MKKKILIIIFISIGIIALILGILIKKEVGVFSKNKIEIIDATYVCNNSPQEFYRDSKYVYYFPCNKSNSIYVKYENGNKELVTTALENGNVTINQLEKAGMTFYKNEK